ncbi:MAG: PAS domain-containing protein, partial [Tepidiformaceae bacterium]
SPGGRTITWELTYYPVEPQPGQVSSVVMITRDVTERRVAEAAVRQSEANLRAIFESAAEGIVLLDCDGCVVSANPAAEKCHSDRFGVPLLAGSKLADLLPDGDRALLTDRLARALAGESFTAQSDYEDGAGSAVNFELTYYPVQLHSGEVSGVAILSRDVTEQKCQEAAVRQSEANLRAIFESSEDGIVLLDRHGSVVALNGALARLRDEAGVEPLVAGHLLVEHLSVQAGAVISDYLARCLTGETITVLSQRITPAGRPLTLEFTYYPVVSAPGEVAGVVIVTRDVTHRKRTEEALLQAQKLESLGVLAGGIAHDFNNLLVGILGNAGLALSEISPSSPARETLKDIQTAGQRAAELARQMLAYSGKGRFVIQQLNLNTLVEELAQLLRSSIGKGVRVAYNFAPDLPVVEADATQIRQVVMNLVVNASDSIGGGEGTISITTGSIEASAKDLAETWLAPDLPEGPYIYLDVSDTGAGMDAGTLKRIFDPFFTTKFTGRGLGLAAVLGIMRGHGGALTVASAPGEGATFRLLLPVATGATTAETAVLPATPQAPVPWRGSGRILIADDEPTVRQVTARALRLFGFEPIEVSDGQEAVEYFEAHSHEIACVLMDMTMPRMNGAEAADRIAAIRPDVPVVLMSGYSEIDAGPSFERGRIAAFVQKPYELAVLRETLRAVIEG